VTGLVTCLEAKNTALQYVTQTNVCVMGALDVLCAIFVKIKNDVENLKIIVFYFLNFNVKSKK